MKVGDVPHSSKKVSFNAHDPIREQLESLPSMVYNMLIQKEENNRPFKPQIYPKRGRGQKRQNISNRNRSFSRDRQGQNFRPNYRGQSQNRCIQCGQEKRRGNYRCQNYNNNDTTFFLVPVFNVLTSDTFYIKFYEFYLKF